MVHISPRLLPLTWRSPPLPDEVVLTVELYQKWYQLYLLYPSGRVEGVDFPDFPQGTPYRDHVPNPLAVKRFALRKGYVYDELAEEMIEGRWALLHADPDALPKLGICQYCGADEGNPDEAHHFPHCFLRNQPAP